MCGFRAADVGRAAGDEKPASEAALASPAASAGAQRGEGLQEPAWHLQPVGPMPQVALLVPVLVPVSLPVTACMPQPYVPSQLGALASGLAAPDEAQGRLLVDAADESASLTTSSASNQVCEPGGGSRTGMSEAPVVVECGTSKVAILKHLIAVAIHDDFDASTRARLKYSSPDFEEHWIDTGFALRGWQEVLPYDHISFQHMRYRKNAMWVGDPQEVDGKVEVRVRVEGIQDKPVTPMFPCGVPTQWLGVIQASFDSLGLIERISIRLEPIPGVGLDCGNLQAIQTSAKSLALTPTGSRLLQLGLEAATGTARRVSLAVQLRGHVWEVAGSPHGSHVLQRYIAESPSHTVEFIVEELTPRAVEAARHPSASHVLERLLQHCSFEQLAPLVEELLDSFVPLCRDRCGNFVVQRLLEHGGPEQRRRAAAALEAADVCGLARHRVANITVRAAIAHCALEDKLRISRILMADPRGFASLSKHVAGSFVAREMKAGGLVG